MRKNPSPDSVDEKVMMFLLRIFETYRQMMRPIEVLYAIKRDLLGFIRSKRKFACKKKVLKSIERRTWIIMIDRPTPIDRLP